MNNTEEISVRFWVENSLTSPEANTVSSDATSALSFSLPASLKTDLTAWLKKNKISVPLFYNMAFGLLCNRYIASSNITFGFAVGHKNNQTNQINVKSEIKSIESKITAGMTIKQYSKNIAKELDKKQGLQQTILHYILLEKSQERKKIKDLITINTAYYPLILSFDAKQPSKFEIIYNNRLFEKEIVEEIGNHFFELISSMINGKVKDITKFSILTESEKSFYYNQLKGSSFTDEQFDIKSSVGDLFAITAGSHANKIAIYHEENKITYGELNHLSSLLAAYLLHHSIGEGNTICVYSERNILLMIYMLAIFKIGAIFVPINSKYPNERIEYILNDSDASLLITDQPLKFNLPANLKHLELQSLDQVAALKNHLNEFTLNPIKPDAIAYIIYTSGTTGQPKGVMVEHKSLINLSNWYCNNFYISHLDHASQFASQGFDTFFCETIPFLLIGASVHIIEDQIKLTPTLFFDWIAKHQITICDIPTAYAKVLFSMHWPPLATLKTVKIGGESIKKYPEQIFSFDIWNTYGPTEATVEATYKKIYSAYSAVNHALDKHVPPIGKPIHHSSIWIVDQYDELVPHGVSGELLIGGVNLARGYWKKSDLTKKKFITNPFISKPNSRLYRTGDLVRMLPNGDLEYIGRRDDQVKIRGYRVELGEIESVMSQYPDVRDVAVIVKENANHEKQIYAYVVPDLERLRFIFQQSCILRVGDHCVEALTENFSKGGIRLSSVSNQSQIGETVSIDIKLPGAASNRTFKGRVIWKEEAECGIAFELTEDDQQFLYRSIQFYLSSQNTQEIVARSAIKRNIKFVLKKALPEYMLPSTIITLLDMPVTFSGKIDKHALPDPNKYLQPTHDVIQPKTEKEKKLAEIWSSVLNKPVVSLGDSFFELGGNSLLVAELSIKILETFGVLIPVNILFDLPYLAIQAEYLETGGEKYNTQSQIQELIQKDIDLPEYLRSTGHLSQYVKSPKNILLTGAGGFLGVFLLKALLENSDAIIYCFIRKGDFETPIQRLLQVVEKFELQNYISISNRRIVVIGGDLSQNCFGLPRDLYDALAKKIDLIFHCGAQVNTMASYDTLRGSNVLGTLEVIKFAVSEVDKPIHYVSTLSAAYLKNENGELDEAFPIDDYGDLTGGYALSKWAAECLLTKMNARGLPIVIYRSGYIGGFSKTGVTNLNDALLMLIKGCIQLGVAPDIHEKITLLPVDFVAYSITKIALTYPTKTEVYHVDHPTGIMWADLVDWLNKYGYRVQLITLSRFQKLLSMISKQNALYPLLPYYLSLKEGKLAPEVVTTNYFHALSECHLICPLLDSDLLTLYFNYLRSVNFLPALSLVETNITSKT